MNKEPFYSLTNILSHKADYNVIYGERSNGKTTSVLRYAIEDYINSGYENQLGLIRRYEEDFKGKNGQQMFDGIIKLGWIKKLTKGKYNSVYYWSQRWYLCSYNDKGEKIEQEKEPFALGFAISSEEHYKSTSYPNVKSILFDEFITRGFYLPEEFVKFQNLLSTIIRLRTDVTIFMCGNTINKYCPYFNEMGLKGVRKQKKGTIDLYSYGDSVLKVAVEYSDFPSKKKISNKYFAFDNPKLQMITDGGWEIDIYPHLPVKYRPKDVLYNFYVKFDTDLLEGKIIYANEELFIYIHRKTTPIKEDNTQIVYQQEISYKYNISNNIFRPRNRIEKLISDLLSTQKTFYQDNEVGEIFSNFLKCCKGSD